MSVEKMVAKTKEVLDKQRELNTLVIEMKDEVRAVHQENIALRKRIEELESQSPGSIPAPSIEPEVARPVTPPPKEQSLDPVTTPQPVPTDIPKKPAPKPFPVKQPSSRKPRTTTNPLMEFFLGKNVIVKIAAVLMVLAIITFGQIAYVDFLNDVGRFVLILGIGLLSIVLGYVFEQKKNDVFSNIFYIIGLAVLLANSFLGQFEYELYDNVVHILYMLAITIAPLFYFWNKRSPFLDTSLVPYYFVVLGSSMALFFDIEMTVLPFLLLVALIGVSGFAIIAQLILYKRELGYYATVDLTILLIATAVINLSIGIIVQSPEFSFAHVIVLMYQIFFIGLFYAYNITKLKHHGNEIQLYTLLVTTLSFIVLSIGLRSSYEAIFNVTNNSLMLLFSTLLLLPLYVHLYRHQDASTKDVTSLYLVISGIMALIFTFFVNQGTMMVGSLQREVDIELNVRNIILVVETILLFLSAVLTKDRIQRLVSYVFMGMMVVVYLMYYGFANHPTGFGSYELFLYSIVGALVLYLIEYFLGDNSNENKDIITVLAIIVAIPLFTAIGSEWLYDRQQVLLMMTVLWLIGSRYLTTLPALRTKYEQVRYFYLNIAIVALVLFTNFIYFDHNFDLFPKHLLLFFLVLIGNGYIVQSLREIYIVKVQKMNISPETFFIVLYLIGVFVQAVFVTQYINFSFDKVMLSSYYMIAASISILWGFRNNWISVRRLGLFAIYFSLLKFFVYDFWANDFDLYVRFVSYFMLALVLFGISALYSYLERKYGVEEHE